MARRSGRPAIHFHPGVQIRSAGRAETRRLMSESSPTTCPSDPPPPYRGPCAGRITEAYVRRGGGRRVRWRIEQSSSPSPGAKKEKEVTMAKEEERLCPRGWQGKNTRKELKRGPRIGSPPLPRGRPRPPWNPEGGMGRLSRRVTPQLRHRRAQAPQMSTVPLDAAPCLRRIAALATSRNFLAPYLTALRRSRPEPTSSPPSGRAPPFG
jgi:hypothetical protein